MTCAYAGAHGRTATAEAKAATASAANAAGTASADDLAAAKALLEQEQTQRQALEEENKALRGQVATVLSYLDQVMPMEGEQQPQQQ